MCTGNLVRLRPSISHRAGDDVKLKNSAPSGRLRVRPDPRSEAHLDDGLAADLRQPFLEPGLVLLLVEDVADLVPGLGELLARERLLRIELEEVIADLCPEGRRVLTGREPQDGRLDVRGQL